MRAVQILGDLATHFWGCGPRTPDLGLEPRTSRLEVLRSIQLSQPGIMVSFRSSDNSVSDTGTRTPARGVKTLDPNQLDYIGFGDPNGNRTHISSV